MKILKLMAALCLGLGMSWTAYAGPFKVSTEMMERFDLQTESSEALPGEKLFMRVHFYGGDMSPECRSASEGQTPQECDLLTPLIPYEVVEWSVNGIRNGNGTVGAISALTDGRVTYIAPAEPPKRNPVAVTAKVRVGTQEILVSSEITVHPPNKWEGYVTYVFEANYREAEPGVNRVTNGKVVFSGAYEVAEVLTDSYNDDGTGLVMLVLGPREAEYDFDEQTKDDCERRTMLKGHFLKGLNMPPPKQSLQLKVGKEDLTFENVMPIFLHAEGEWYTRGCKYDKGLEGSGETEDFINLDFMIEGAFKAHLDNGTYQGSLQEDRTFRFSGAEYPGTLTMEWVFRRHN